ncbi:MAG: Uma2 family endonuclease [Oscillospiraceae bacterium]|nr:Uma2 family endonuclease [Oscillospiraceae bacterium]
MQNYNYEPNGIFKESRRTEIHDGKIYYMAGTSMGHNEITGNVFRIFSNYLRGKKCRVYGENANVIFKKGFRRFMPDVKIVCDPGKIKKDGIYGAPDLIIEILSPGTDVIDLGYKKDVYEENGVQEYWIISPEAKSITVYLLKNGRYAVDNVYRYLKNYESDYGYLEDEERENIKFEFKTSLYDDLIISVEEVFENVD